MLKDLRAADVIALVTISGCFALIALGHSDPVVTSVLLTVIGFYFGRISARSENGTSSPKGAANGK